LWATAETAIIQRGSLMLLLLRIWRIVWVTRVTLSLILFLVVIIRKAYREFPLFSIHSAWFALAGAAVLVVDYSPRFNGLQYFAAVAISNGVEAILAFAIIYQMFTQRLSQYPAVRDLGTSAFRASTLVLVGAALALAWFSPGPASTHHWTSIYSMIDRTVRLLQCGQLLFVFLFIRYFRISWRSRAFGIALGLGILSSSSLAVNAIRFQTASDFTQGATWHLLALTSDSTSIVAILVWLAYFLAPERVPPEDSFKFGDDSKPPDSGLPEHDLETWNRELQRLL
jgi:hypothetical protein